LNAKLLLVVVTLCVVILSALGVVYTRHESRQLEVHLDKFENQRDAVIAEWSRLQLEEAWLADAGQVESKARNHLGMRVPDKPHILVVKP